MSTTKIFGAPLPPAFGLASGESTAEATADGTTLDLAVRDQLKRTRFSGGPAHTLHYYAVAFPRQVSASGAR